MLRGLYCNLDHIHDDDDENEVDENNSDCNHDKCYCNKTLLFNIGFIFNANLSGVEHRC